jgi:hypothetical protein
MEVYNLNGLDTYSLSKAKRAKETFEGLANWSRKYTLLYNLIAYSMDFTLFLFAVLLFIDEGYSYISGPTKWFILSTIPIIKGYEVSSNIKGRVVALRMLSENYRIVLAKITDALEALEVISYSGITDEELKTWSNMLRLIEALTQSTRNWPKVYNAVEVESALDHLRDIERGIFIQQSNIRLSNRKYHYV